MEGRNWSPNNIREAGKGAFATGYKFEYAHHDFFVKKVALELLFRPNV